jgi:hypothetical protein
VFLVEYLSALLVETRLGFTSRQTWVYFPVLSLHMRRITAGCMNFYPFVAGTVYTIRKSCFQPALSAMHIRGFGLKTQTSYDRAWTIGVYMSNVTDAKASQ